MGSNSLNLALRFILEMTALFSLGYWGWIKNEGYLKYILVIGLPILFMVIWGVFAVPDDPSRSGKTVVVTAGWLRLLIELALFGTAFWTFKDAGLIKISWAFLGLAVIHYALSYDRMIWLFKQ